MKSPQKLILSGLFDNICARSQDRCSVDQIDGSETIKFQSGDGCELLGYVYRTPGQGNDRGTCFLLHGFTDNCTMSWNLEKVRQLSRDHDITVFAYDSRYHGWSSKDSFFPTFGCAESYDVQAAMDYAASRMLPEPYILHGTSLGGMAAQRAAIVDSRVKGLFLVSTPGWPWDAIGVSLKLFVHAGKLINACYGWDILKAGDIRLHDQSENHIPLVCYIMGDQDHYNIQHTIDIFNSWHKGEHGAWDVPANEQPDFYKFFQVVPGAVHPGIPGSQVMDWSGYGNYEAGFYKRVLASAGLRQL
jgi:pimeloyl-ACP methyl ester carboxylesterase